MYLLERDLKCEGVNMASGGNNTAVCNAQQFAKCSPTPLQVWTTYSCIILFTKDSFSAERNIYSQYSPVSVVINVSVSSSAGGKI